MHATLLVTKSCFKLWQLTENQNVWRTTRNYSLAVCRATPFIFLIWDADNRYWMVQIITIQIVKKLHAYDRS